MITGTMKSELDGNARIWTLTVPVQPRPGELIEWSEPALGSIPASSGIRGWISSQESNRPGTQILTVAGCGSRWVIVNVVPPLTIGVSNVNRSAIGSRYTITRNSDSRIAVGYVEITGDLWNVRDALNEPVRVGSTQYALMRAAVKAYQSWAERH